MNNLNLTNIKKAFIDLSQKTEQQKNNFLVCLADVINRRRKEIIKSNQRDVKVAIEMNLSNAFIERLVLDELGLKKIITKLKKMQKLNSSLGEVIERRELENKVVLKKIRTPIGVIAVIYESRPEVTIDVAALCIKSGNVAILKGGLEALLTNKALYRCIKKALTMVKIDTFTINLVTTRESVNSLLKRSNDLDLVIARGGYDLVKAVVAQSKVPVLAHSAGGARIYIDKSADLKVAESIVINAKVSKPSACNSLDTILIHKDIADSFILELIKQLGESQVTVSGDDYISKLANVKKTTDWNTEFLDLTVSIKIVEDVDEAIQFINKYTKRHSEGIIAEDKNTINKFTKGIDAAAIFVNCSTRLHDGYEFGMGAEMGIATGKLHSRGPVGLKELTTYKWEVYGNGQVRE